MLYLKQRNKNTSNLINCKNWKHQVHPLKRGSDGTCVFFIEKEIQREANPLHIIKNIKTLNILNIKIHVINRL